METRDRSFYPDSPKPGHGNLSNWLASPYSVVVITIGLFIIIFGIAIFLGYRQFETTRHDALSADRTTVNLLADLVLEHNKATIAILQSYAHRALSSINHAIVDGQILKDPLSAGGGLIAGEKYHEATA